MDIWWNKGSFDVRFANKSGSHHHGISWYRKNSTTVKACWNKLFWVRKVWTNLSRYFQSYLGMTWYENTISSDFYSNNWIPFFLFQNWIMDKRINICINQTLVHLLRWHQCQVEIRPRQFHLQDQSNITLHRLAFANFIIFN